MRTAESGEQMRRGDWLSLALLVAEYLGLICCAPAGGLAGGRGSSAISAGFTGPGEIRHRC
jgi:hypothetical protein